MDLAYFSRELEQNDAAPVGGSYPLSIITGTGIRLRQSTAKCRDRMNDKLQHRDVFYPIECVRAGRWRWKVSPPVSAARMS